MNDFPRLIEHAFPLKQTSLDSVHEKNVRHGHISTLHIWPARRPLAACRAALIATLLPDPGTPEARRELCEKIGGKVVKVIERKKMPNGQTVERVKEETVGGILHWGRETENAADLEWFRQEIRKAYGGRAPKVLDPFAGGGAIPLEAMRLGCEATAVDINPVAWFILKCTLEYPQKLAGQKRPLPAFILKNRPFMESFFEAQGLSKAQIRKRIERLGHKLNEGEQLSLPLNDGDHDLDADLAWHVRAWGQWVLDRARCDLAKFYPTYADFEPIKKGEVAYEPQPMQLVPLREDGTADIDALNPDFTKDYLADPRNPRWVAKPTVAYLWARTVTCKNCRATIPLLKTRWISRKGNARARLTITPSAAPNGVLFGIETRVPIQGANAAQRRQHDRNLGTGTMSKSGAKCPCCGAINTSESIRVAGQSKQLSTVLTAVVLDGPDGKEYRLPTEGELAAALVPDGQIDRYFAELPGGRLNEPIPQGASRVGGGSPFTAYLYGVTKWEDLFTSRQLCALACFARQIRATYQSIHALQLPEIMAEAMSVALALSLDKLADRSSRNCRWDIGYTKVANTFNRFALPFLWDYCEANPLSTTTGNYLSCVEWVAEVLGHVLNAGERANTATVARNSAIGLRLDNLDAILTDPPYYDAIPYSDLMDFFYVWLRRTLSGFYPKLDAALAEPLSPKWDNVTSDGELVDDASRHGGSHEASKLAYENGMERAFRSCHAALASGGRLVVVFAHKKPDAWEALAGAIIRAGFVVDGSWPIQTEMANRTRAHSSAALASSVWLCCRKRPETAKPGWDQTVLADMRYNIGERLREYWDAGIRGPDFVWAATGPAMEAYSKHPVVKKANNPNETMTVTEFLNHVRRMVVDYVVGQVLSGEKTGEADMAAADRLDETTAYYLLHRHDFGLGEAPTGTCILYAVSCGLSDRELVDTWDILAKTGEQARDDEEDTTEEAEGDSDAEAEVEESGGKVRLKVWSARKNKSMGYEAPNARPVPLIDRVHRLMHIWRGGDLHKVDEYLDEHGLRRHELFKRLVQSLIELSEAGGDERALLESLSNHIGGKGAKADADQMKMGFGVEN